MLDIVTFAYENAQYLRKRVSKEYSQSIGRKLGDDSRYKKTSLKKKLQNNNFLFCFVLVDLWL